MFPFVADPSVLHHLALHIGMRVLGGLFAVASVASVVIFAVEKGAGRPLKVALATLPAMVVMILRATVWRTRPVRARENHLEVGAGARPRRIAYADILSLDRAWWARAAGALAPVELTVRDADPVLFFPAPGAAVYLASRLGAAHLPTLRPPPPPRHPPTSTPASPKPN
jgi:hypothetical protein